MLKTLISLYPDGTLQVYEVQKGEKCYSEFANMMKCINLAGEDIPQLINRQNKKIQIEKGCKEMISQWDKCITKGKPKSQ